MWKALHGSGKWAGVKLGGETVFVNPHLANMRDLEERIAQWEREAPEREARRKAEWAAYFQDREA